MNDLADKLCGLLAEHALDGDRPALHAMRDALEKTGVADALKDAERYRRMRDKFSWTLTSGPDGTRISVHMPGVDVTAIGPGEDEFDAAIDAAMRKEGANT